MAIYEFWDPEFKLPEEDFAADFIDKLHNARFSGLKSLLKDNLTTKSGTYPGTVTEAHQVASKYESEHGYVKKRTEGHATAYQAEESGTAKEKSSDAPKKAKKGKDKFPAKKSCQLCPDLNNHNLPECFKLKTIQEQLASKKTGKAGKKALAAKEESEDECFICTVDCTDIEKAYSATDGATRDWTVLLDNQSSASVIRNPKLLKNIRHAKQPMILNGIGGNMMITHEGDTDNFGTVYYSRNCPANILSFGKVEDLGVTITYNSQKKRFKAKTPLRSFYFKRDRNMLHVCTLQHKKNSTFINTVEKNEAMRTKRELERAKDAAKLHATLGFPDYNAVSKLINTGGIINCKVTSKDVRTAVEIFGPAAPMVKGTTRTKKVAPAMQEPTQAEELVQQDLHTDLMFVEGAPFVISVSTPMGYTMANSVQNRQDMKILGVLAKQIAAYKAKGYTIKNIISDNEGGVKASTTALNGLGVTAKFVGPGTHEKVVENKIRQVKARARSILQSLPYILPDKALPALIEHAANCTNMVPSSTRVLPVTAKELFTGEKLNYSTECRLQFGEYVQVFNPPGTSHPVPVGDTEGAIALSFGSNSTGVTKFYIIARDVVVSREQWRVVPMPREAIEHLNKPTELNRKCRSRDPIFQLGATTLENPAISSPDSENPENYSPDFSENEVRNEVSSLHQNESEHQEHTIPSTEAETSPELQDDLQRGGDATFETPAQPEEELEQESSTQLDDIIMQQDTLTESAINEPEEHDSGPETSEPVRTSSPQASQKTTRSGRSVKSRYDDDYAYASKQLLKVAYNMTIQESLKKYSTEALASIFAELSQMVDKEVFHPVQASSVDRKKVIPSSMFLKEKLDLQGVLEKIKARLVGGGHRQIRELYDEDLYSPTVRLEHIFVLAAIAAQKAKAVRTADVTGAYLNASMDKSKRKVHMRLQAIIAQLLVILKPEWQKFLLEDGSMIVELDKCLYGCIESAKQWYLHLRDTMLSLGFTENAYDGCVFSKEGITIAFHVDDLFIIADTDDIADNFIKELRGAYNQVTVRSGDTHEYLGMTFEFNRKKKTVEIGQLKMIKEILQDYDYKGHATSPAGESLFTVEEGQPLSETEAKKFHTGVAKLLYLSKRSRPDLLTTVSFLTSRVREPNTTDQRKLVRAIKFLHNTKDDKLTLGGSKRSRTYADASHACHGDLRGHTGGFYTLGRGAIYAESGKQKLNTKSTGESELVGASDMGSIAIGLDAFLKSILKEKLLPTWIGQDNTSAIAMIKNGKVTSKRSRHIDIGCFWLGDRLKKGEVEIVHVPTKEMHADILTKPLQGEIYSYHRDILMGNTPCNGGVCPDIIDTDPIFYTKSKRLNASRR